MGFLEQLLLRLLHSLITIVIGFIFHRIMAAVITKAFSKPNADEYHRYETISRLLIDAVKYIIRLICALYILYVLFGTTIQSFLTIAGAGGIMVGLAAQNLIKDIFSGFFLLFDGYLVVGDIVTIGNAKGVVEDLGLRVTKVRTEEGALAIVPNGEIRVIINNSR
jgi:small conductance mechanosensitive channel